MPNMRKPWEQGVDASGMTQSKQGAMGMPMTMDAAQGPQGGAVPMDMAMTGKTAMQGVPDMQMGAGAGDVNGSGVADRGRAMLAPTGAGAGAGVDKMIAQKKVIGEEQIVKAELTLQKYKAGKARLERRIVAAQQWWKLRNWEEIERKEGIRGAGDYKSNSAWLWNCIVGKHADFMDAFPEPNILPRAQDDEEEAERLSEIVPVVMDQVGFEQTYSDAMWSKVTEGTAIYSCMWDRNKLNGLGDISIGRVNALNLFWQPGVHDIQESRHVFNCALVDTDVLEEQYPDLKGKAGGDSLMLTKYMYDDQVSTDGKTLVVDWYYHRYDQGKKILHYCKFAGHNVLYSTENEGMTDGLYSDGLYPFVFDTLYPVEGSPCGMGLIDIGRGAQTDIDMMNQAMVTSAVMASTPRFFIRKDGSVNEDEFADWSRPLVHVSGNLGNDSIQPIQSNPLANLSVSFLQQKVEELKFVTGNVDINNGSTPSGVTAASAIAALKEDAGRSSKDSNKSAYRAYRNLVTMVIERIRQFYDMPRQFRIVGPRGEAKYQQYSNEGLQMQAQGSAFGQDMGMRLPVFDINVRAQRENAYTKTAQNELALQFYQLGFFQPETADAALMALDMMDFRGKEELMEKVQQNQTLLQTLQQMTQVAAQIAATNGDAEGLQAVQMLTEQAAGAVSAMGGAGGAAATMPDTEAQYNSETSGNNAGRMNRFAKGVNDAKRPEA